MIDATRTIKGLFGARYGNKPKTSGRERCLQYRTSRSSIRNFILRVPVRPLQYSPSKGPFTGERNIKDFNYQLDSWIETNVILISVKNFDHFLENLITKVSHKSISYTTIY